MTSIAEEHELLTDLLSALGDRNSALGTYLRSLSKEQLKDFFGSKSSWFLQRGIRELSRLENYEICATFFELLNEKKEMQVME